MDILSLLFTLAVVGFVLWILVTYVPMPEPYRKVLIVLVVLMVVWWAIRILAGSGLLLLPRTP